MLYNVIENTLPSHLLVIINRKENMKAQSQNCPKKDYIKINGCSNPLPISQILALALMGVILILSFNLIPSILNANSEVLYGLLAFDYILFLLITISYLYLVLMDPADPRLKDRSFKQAGETLQFCSQCQAQVHESSYHCKTCERCVQKFDHHCAFANNCIGGQNYNVFFILLLTLIVYTSTNIGIGMWLTFSLTDSYRWVAVAYSALSFLVFVEISVLAIFHTYISFFLYKTTLQVLRGDKVAEENPNQRTIILKVDASKPQEQSKLQMKRQFSGEMAVRTEMPLKAVEAFS